MSTTSYTFSRNFTRMADNIPDRLRRARKRQRYTQEEMAQRAGVKRTTYANYELGVAAPPDSVLERLRPYLEEGGTLVSEATGYIKVIGTIDAGYGDGSAPDTADSVLHVPLRFANQSFGGVVAQGDSMMPYIHPGDTLIFKTTRQPRVNKFIAARPVGGGHAVIKKAAMKDGRIVLQSLNPIYSDLDLAGYEVIGILVGVHSVNGDMTLGPHEGGIDEAYYSEHLWSRMPKEI